MLIPVSKVLPNPEQPRRKFDKTQLRELADSILIHGVLTPILVYKVGDNYVLKDGERRLRA